MELSTTQSKAGFIVMLGSILFIYTKNSAGDKVAY